MSVANRAAKMLSKTAEPTAADDFKMAKKLNRQIKAARKEASRSEDVSANSAAKQKVKEAEAAFDAWESGYRKRLDERMKEYTTSTDSVPKEVDEKAKELAKGGMVVKSRSNSLNKFYGK